MSHYIDIHTHLTHSKFADDWQQVLQKAVDQGLKHIVVNGLEPESNRKILEWSDTYEAIVPALGIYPLEAANAVIAPNEIEIDIARFPVDDELHFIETQAMSGRIKAIGECGLDGYWVGEKTFPEQERVFKALIDIAQRAHLPLIIHTRKREKRSMEILKDMQVKRVNFHCYGGKTKMAIQASKDHGWWFSIPANARKNEAFTKLLKELPEEKVLTETDAPYLSPERGERNEPANVVGTIAYLAELKNWSVDKARERVFKNYERLMNA